MRRHRQHVARHGKRKRTVLTRILLVILAVIVMFAVLDARLRPIITTMASYQCRVISVLAMNEAVMAELEAYPKEAGELTRVEKSANGKVSSIEVNTGELNRLKTRLTAAVSLRLMELENQTISIPLGTLLGWQLLAGRGPNISLKVVPTSFVHTTTQDEVETAGINQTNHRIIIHFSVEMSALLPGYTTSVTVENDICVAETVIVGEVPQFYAMG